MLDLISTNNLSVTSHQIKRTETIRTPLRNIEKTNNYLFDWIALMH